LADHANKLAEYLKKCERCQEFGSLVNQRRCTNYPPPPMALCYVGDGHYKTLPSRKRSMPISFGGSRLLYKVG